MNSLLVAFCASALALSTASAPAQGLSADSDMKPLSKMETKDAKAAAATAKAKWAAMTPEQQTAAEKAARAKKQSELTALDNLACDFCYNSKAPLVGDFWSPNDTVRGLNVMPEKAPVPPAVRQQP
jgi:hypothetical protein